MNLGPASPRAGVGLLEDEAGPGYSRLAVVKVWGSGDSESGACPLVYGSWSSGLWLQCPVGPNYSACTLVSGARFLVLQRIRPCPGMVVGSEGLKTAYLLVGGAASPAS